MSDNWISSSDKTESSAQELWKVVEIDGTRFFWKQVVKVEQKTKNIGRKFI